MRISDWSSDLCSSDLHKQIVKDSTISGQGLADYIVTFRKPGENAEPVSGCFDEWHGEGDGPDPSKFTTSTDGRNWYSIDEIGRTSCRDRMCKYVYISAVAVSHQNNIKLNSYH